MNSTSNTIVSRSIPTIQTHPIIHHHQQTVHPRTDTTILTPKETLALAAPITSINYTGEVTRTTGPIGYSGLSPSAHSNSTQTAISHCHHTGTRQQQHNTDPTIHKTHLLLGTRHKTTTIYHIYQTGGTPERTHVAATTHSTGNTYKSP